MDIICLNEVDKAMVTQLASNQDIQKNFLMSEKPLDGKFSLSFFCYSNKVFTKTKTGDRNEFNSFRARSFGNVILMRKSSPILWRATHTVKCSIGAGRKSLVVEIDVPSEKRGEEASRVAIASVHLDARCTLAHFKNRAKQLGEVSPKNLILFP